MSFGLGVNIEGASACLASIGLRAGAFAGNGYQPPHTAQPSERGFDVQESIFPAVDNHAPVCCERRIQLKSGTQGVVFELVSGKLSTHRLKMRTIEFIMEWLPTVLQLGVFVQLIRRSLFRRFRIFTFYTAYVIIIEIAGAFLVGRAAYFYVYWCTEFIAVIASVGAIHESFKAIFGGFYQLTWFRYAWPGTIAIIWIYSGWRAWVHPPPHFARAGAVLIQGSITSRFTIVGLVLLFFLLARLATTRWYLYEFHIVYGLGLSSLGMVAAVLVRSEFGTRFAWLTVWGPPLAYLVAVIIWLSAFLRREPEIKINMPPEVLLQEMQADLRIVKTIEEALTRRRARRYRTQKKEKV